MNDDSSVFELPGYMQSRLKPKIELVAPPWKIKEGIVRLKCPRVDADLLKLIFAELKERAAKQCRDSIRDLWRSMRKSFGTKELTSLLPRRSSRFSPVQTLAHRKARRAERLMRLVTRFRNLSAIPSHSPPGFWSRGRSHHQDPQASRHRPGNHRYVV
jgi:hypothetical protein